MTKRRFLLLFTSAILGAFTTVAIVLWSALLGSSGPYESSSIRGSALWSSVQVHAMFRVSSHRRPTHQYVFVHRPIVFQHGENVVSDWDPPIRTVIPPIAVAYAYDFWKSHPRQIDCRLVEFHGWPFPAAYSVSDLAFSNWTPGIAVSATTGFVAPRFTHVRPEFMSPSESIIPLDPIWSGALTNTAIFAAAWSLILIPIPWFRTLLRRRGQCPHCGYDTKGIPTTTCPECGSTA